VRRCPTPGLPTRAQYDGVLIEFVAQLSSLQVRLQSGFLLWPDSGFGSELAQDLVCYVVRIEPTADLLPVLQNPNILQASLPLALESISEIIDWLQVNKAVISDVETKTI
jgi:hypothetical protein